MGPGARAPGARHGRRRRRRRRWDGAGKVVVDGITAAQNGRAQCRYVNHFGLVENFTDSSSPDPKNLPLTSLSCFISTSASSYHQRWLLLIREVWHNFLERPKNRFRDDWTDHSNVERKKNLQTLDQKSFEMNIDWGGLACWVRRRSSKWRPWVRGPPLWRFGPQRWEKGHWFRKKNFKGPLWLKGLKSLIAFFLLFFHNIATFSVLGCLEASSKDSMIASRGIPTKGERKRPQQEELKALLVTFYFCKN